MRETIVAPTHPARHRVPAQDAGAQGMAVWFAVTAERRPGRLWRRVAALAAPEFRLRTIHESARLDTSDGAYRAHWYCVVDREPGHAASDEFAALRFLKRLIGAGFRVLRFDAGDTGEPT